MTAILSTDAAARSHARGGRGLEKGPVQAPAEPLEIVEKDLEQVKEDLEKVSEILRNGTLKAEAAEGAAKAAHMAEDWVLLSDSEIQQARTLAARDVQEPVLRGNRGGRGAPRPKAIKDSGDLQEYLLDAPDKPGTVQQSVPGVLRTRTKGARPSTPPRRRAQDPGQVEEPADAGALLRLPGAPTPAAPVSPGVEETPIGSIRDKVKALQQRVEAEQKSRNVPGSKPSQLPARTEPSPRAKDDWKSKPGPPKGLPKSPKAGSETLEETMSVRELMQAFQTGQDPSKRKSGLFEHKTWLASPSPEGRKSEPIPGKSMTTARRSPVPGGQRVSLDSKPSEKESAPRVEAQGLDDGPDRSKCGGGADSLSASSEDGTSHVSSEDSYKHEGLATPGTSPESVCFPPETGQPAVKESQDPERLGGGTAGDRPAPEMRPPVPSRAAAHQHATSECCSVPGSASKSKRQRLTKRVSETVERFLSDEESLADHQLQLSVAALTASRSSSQCPESFSLPLKQDSDGLSPLADDSLPTSHRDSLDGSPLPEENSSHKSPDSIEPSPTNETPPHDSLETSPVEQRSRVPLLCELNPPGDSSGPPEPFNAAPFALEYLRSRLLQEPEASAEDNSSGKSPLSPHTPSSQEVSDEVKPYPPDHPFHFLPSKPSVIPEDPERGSTSYSDEADGRLTPEEELFKMAAKIKTFGEMEQDARRQKNSKRQDLCPSAAKLCSKLEPSSARRSLGRAPEASNVGLSVDPHVKVQPPFAFPAGLHEGSHRQEVESAAAAAAAAAAAGGLTSERHHSDSDLHLRLPKQQNAQPLEETVGSARKASVPSNSQNRTDEQKQQSLKKSRETTGEDRRVQEPGVAQKDSNVTDEMKGDHMVHTGASQSPTAASGHTEAEESFSDEVEEDEEAREPPKTESKGVTAKVGAESWAAAREDDTTFAARVKEEEQKILNLAVDRQSLQATPDTTPGRTPTEESTPTSEPNPFLFQEGKLFEMTRSGAIDMTKRSYEEEGGAFAFFQIGEQPSEEPLLLEDARQDGAGANVETEVGLNLTLEVKTEERAAAPPPDVDQRSSTADASKSKIPKMGLSASAKLAKRDQAPAEGGDGKTVSRASEGCAGADADSSEQITNVQTAASTVTRSVYAQQTHESSDSSAEESQLVLEAPEPANKAQPNAPSGAKKVPGKPQAKAAPSGRGKSAIASPSRALAPSTAGKKESRGSESKSKIPIKAGGVKAESPVKRVESGHDKKLRVPLKKDTRRKSEADAGPSVGVRTKSASPKASSFCEGESSRPAAKSRSFQSRLPVRGKSGPTSAPATPTKEKSQPLQESVEFFEEISDEAAKLVAQLVQAETEKDREAAADHSDEESSLLEPSLIEGESFAETHFPPAGGVFPLRPRWDRPVETQMQRIPDDRAQRPGTPPAPGALLYLLCLASPVAVQALPLWLLRLGPTLVEESMRLGLAPRLRYSYCLALLKTITKPKQRSR